MPVYEYIAIDPSGKKVKGNIDADNIRVARQKLRTQKIFPTDIKEGKAGAASRSKSDVSTYFKSNKIKPGQLAAATRQLATLIGAGLPLTNALQALSDQTDSEALQRTIIDIREQVEEGSSLSKALGKYPKSFSRLFVNMVAAGEASGTLQDVLDNLADHLEASLALRSKAISALIYPTVMVVFCSLVILLMFIFVIPNVTEMFKQQGATLPLPTQIMIGISDFLIAFWWTLPLFVGLGVALVRWYYQQERGRSKIDRLLLRLPIFGPIYLKIGTARVTQTLGALLRSGVELLRALDITHNIIGNVHMRAALVDARDGVKEGKSLAKELKNSELFPAMVIHMIAVGEKSGSLAQMLTRAGNAYETEVSNTLDGLTSLLEPLLMIVVGGVVLCIVISVLLPLVDLISVVK
ncbi:MAG: type II secretion system inner membrane protein GspF [Bdellovibrionales bacterium]|nr:type II secretion system inner membrane protein GspF [Bdellovibrionales bacterium]